MKFVKQRDPKIKERIAMMCFWNYLSLPIVRLGGLFRRNPRRVRCPSVLDPTTIPAHWRRDLGIDL